MPQETHTFTHTCRMVCYPSPVVQLQFPMVTSIKVMLRLPLHPQTATLAPGQLAITIHLPALFSPTQLMRKPYLSHTHTHTPHPWFSHAWTHTGRFTVCFVVMTVTLHKNGSLHFAQSWRSCGDSAASSCGSLMTSWIHISTAFLF